MLKIIQILLIALSLCVGAYPAAYATASGPSEEETALLELINQARKDPLAMAESLGMSRETVLANLPELKNILTEGLSPLTADDKLYASALGHTQEMIAKIYYSRTSLDGRTYADRIKASGYLPAACGESLGMLAFQNYMPIADAVSIIFKNVFLEELNPKTTTERNILNPERTDAGIALGLGQFVRGGATLNAYVATLDFGKPVVDARSVERALARMLNAARNDSGTALLNAGLDPSRAAAAYGTYGWVFAGSLAPFATNDTLRGTATAHNREMCSQRYFNTLSLGGLTPFERVEAAGYGPAFVGESLGVLSVAVDPAQGVSAWDVARRLYEKLLQRDVNPELTVERNIFTPIATEAGISVETLLLDPSDETSITCVVVVDVAQPMEQRSFVVGTVYEDLNHNGLMDDGEGIPDLKITVQPAQAALWDIVSGESDSNGIYQVSLSTLPTGRLHLYVQREGEVVGPFTADVETPGVNILKNIRIEPKSAAASATAARPDEKKLDRSMRICY